MVGTIIAGVFLCLSLIRDFDVYKCVFGGGNRLYAFVYFLMFVLVYYLVIVM